MTARLNTNNEILENNSEKSKRYDAFFESEEMKEVELLFQNGKFNRFKMEDIINQYNHLYGNVNPDLWSKVLSVKKRLPRMFIYMFDNKRNCKKIIKKSLKIYNHYNM